MREKNTRFPADRTETERRKNLSEDEIRELELAGGVEGGMQAGSAGGPGEQAAGPRSDTPSRKTAGSKVGQRAPR